MEVMGNSGSVISGNVGSVISGNVGSVISGNVGSVNSGNDGSDGNSGIIFSSRGLMYSITKIQGTAN